MLYQDVEAYRRRYSICLALKIVRHKLYNDLRLLPVYTYYWKDHFINFVISLPILTNWKRDSYDTIFVMVNYLIKMIYYKLVKISRFIKNLHLRNSKASLLSQLNNQWLKFTVYFKVMIITISFFWY